MADSPPPPMVTCGNAGAALYVGTGPSRCPWQRCDVRFRVRRLPRSVEQDHPERAVPGLRLRRWLLPVGAHFRRELARGEDLSDLVDLRGRRKVVETDGELLDHLLIGAYAARAPVARVRKRTVRAAVADEINAQIGRYGRAAQAELVCQMERRSPDLRCRARGLTRCS